MSKKRYLIEIGQGVDMHGSNQTNAAKKAVKDAISHCCMAGIKDVIGKEISDISLDIKLFSPNPEKIDIREVRGIVDFYNDVNLQCLQGGGVAEGVYVSKFGEGTNITVVLAIITVYVNM